MVQRMLQIGFNRAAQMLEAMEKDGIVTRMDRDGRRKVLPVAEPTHPPNCGTGHCSCIECLHEPASAPRTEARAPEALRVLAQECLWTGQWYDAGCGTVNCTYDKDATEHDEIAHPCPIGITEYIAAVQPRAVLALLDDIDRLHAENEALKAQVQAAPAAQPDAQLCQFYDVTTAAELIAAQAAHIEKLQAKLPAAPTIWPTKAREG